ncbi:hypothetical protein QSV08_06140 [Maribacter sp. BPC-D8]|uniref:hypothetical protein n=1 Tax=Maribacter sp. BPC-D8 TaxID=3053613 RepID=UPI002B492FB0|nr:hypothetical protein [Maribacter sp. BPC-D8]WRI30823.1 hypothetical protein QSV08_06140 [Maribacter sp. BPC-D8]
MKKLKTLFYLFVLLIFMSCVNNNKQPQIIGSWNLIHIYKDGVDVLGNDKVKEVYRIRNLYIEQLKINQITIELNRNEDLYADFEINKGIITLSRSTHPEYEGKYQIMLTDTLLPFFKSAVKSLKISSLDKNIQIYAAMSLSEYNSNQ